MILRRRHIRQIRRRRQIIITNLRRILITWKRRINIRRRRRRRQRRRRRRRRRLTAAWGSWRRTPWGRPRQRRGRCRWRCPGSAASAPAPGWPPPWWPASQTATSRTSAQTACPSPSESGGGWRWVNIWHLVIKDTGSKQTLKKYLQINTNVKKKYYKNIES